MKNIKILLCFITAIIILLGGCNVNQEEHIYDDQTIAKAKEATQNFIKNNFEGVKSIEVEEPYRSPMGAMKSKGKVNREFEFTITINENYSVDGISVDEGFPKMKEECKEKACD